MMDMDDALGQENLKTTLIADQGADTILNTANQMESQVAVTTPGSNPYLSAQAQVANLRCQAYMQKMLAAELRQEAGRLAHDNALLKRRTTITGGINSLITERSRRVKESLMTDAKKSTNKVRKPFFWQRRHDPSSVAATLSSSVTPAKTEGRPWYRPTLLKFAVVLLAALTILPVKAHGQFGIDVAAILAALQKMQSLMTTYIAGPLKTVNQYEQTTAKYEQQVMYPLAAINQAKNSVVQFENQFSQVSNLFHVKVASATLPQSGNLESLLLSRNATMWAAFPASTSPFTVS